MSTAIAADTHVPDTHGHAHAVAEAPNTDVLEGGRESFTPYERAKGVFIISVVAAIIMGVCVVFAGATAGLHWVMKQFIADEVFAASIGNGIATAVLIPTVWVMILATLLTMGERKWSAFIQDRMGPNRARLPIPGLSKSSLFGLPHIAADVLKMLTKEEIVPAAANKVLFHLAPALAFSPVFVLFAVIPMSPTFEFMGERISMFVASYAVKVNGQIEFVGLDLGLLYLFAIASIAVFGVSLAGWSSNNKYALLGGIRASAQMISYEVTLGLTLVGLMIVFETLKLDVMTVRQGELLWGAVPAWGFIFQPLAIFAYFAAASAEMKRAPFDLPEGESEIVGYFIEYSGLKFGIFMIAEFVEVVVFSGVFTVLFFGGYHLPWVEPSLSAWFTAHGIGWAMGLVQFFTFSAKTVFFCWLSLTVRWTFPRFRYDQIMNLGWKILLPLCLANVVITGMLMLWGGQEAVAAFGIVEILLVLGYGIGTFDTKRIGGETALRSAGADGGVGHGADSAAAHAHH